MVSVSARLGRTVWKWVVVGAAGSGIAMVAASARADTMASSTYPVSVEYAPETAALAQMVLAGAERAWRRHVVELGYPAPFTTGSDPPAQGMVFRVEDTGMGAGVALAKPVADVPSTPIADCSAVVVIDAATELESDAVDEAAYHEFNHTTQFATDCTEPMSAYEGFAIAATRAEFPDSTIVRWVLREFQKLPGYPLDYWTMRMPCRSGEPCAAYQLGAAMFPMYLVDRFGDREPAVLADIFGRFSQDGSVTVSGFGNKGSAPNHPNWFEGVATYVQEHGSTFSEAFCEFSAWRAVVGERDDGTHFTWGSELPSPAVAGEMDVDGNATGTFEVHEYGTAYVEIHPKERSGTQAWRVKVDVDPAATWCGSILAWKSDGSVSRVVLDEQRSAAMPEADDAARVLLVVSQLQDDSHVPDAKDYAQVRAFSVRFEQDALDAGAEAMSAEPGVEAGADGVEDPGAGPVLDEGDAGGWDEAAAPPGAHESPGETGCGCRATPGPGSFWGIGAGALLGVAWMIRSKARNSRCARVRPSR